MLSQVKHIYDGYCSFEKDKEACRQCSVGMVYGKVVLSSGCKENPKVIVVGEAPGKDEVEQGEPFVGKAGKLLRLVLGECGFRKTNSLISNIIPCRPENNKFPQDASLVKACSNKWLVNEILLTKPSQLLLLGSQPLKYVLGLSGITKLRGKWYDFSAGLDEPIKCMPTFHPSYVLRKKYMSGGKAIRQSFEEDIKTVAKAAGFVV